MKQLRSSYLLFNLAKGKSEWSFTLPSGLMSTNSPEEVIKLYVKKMVYRNDFEVITANRDTFTVDGVAKAIRHGSPNALLLAEELSTKHADIRWTFDGYTGALQISNISATTSHTVGPGTLGSVLGMTGPITLTPGSQAPCPLGVDLAPPELIVLRMRGLSSSSLEITEKGATVSDLLVTVGSDVSPYQTKVYRDGEGQYSHFLQQKELTDISLALEDSEGTPLASGNQITIILAVEFWRDDESDMLSLTREGIDMQKLALVGAHLNKP